MWLFIVGWLFYGWWTILPDPLFQVPYATLLEDRQGELIGLKNAKDEQLRSMPA